MGATVQLRQRVETRFGPVERVKRVRAEQAEAGEVVEWTRQMGADHAREREARRAQMRRDFPLTAAFVDELTAAFGTGQVRVSQVREGGKSRGREEKPGARVYPSVAKSKEPSIGPFTVNPPFLRYEDIPAFQDDPDAGPRP